MRCCPTLEVPAETALILPRVTPRCMTHVLQTWKRVGDKYHTFCASFTCAVLYSKRGGGRTVNGRYRPGLWALAEEGTDYIDEEGGTEGGTPLYAFAPSTNRSSEGRAAQVRAWPRPPDTETHSTHSCDTPAGHSRAKELTAASLFSRTGLGENK